MLHMGGRPSPESGCIYRLWLGVPLTGCSSTLRSRGCMGPGEDWPRVGHSADGAEPVSMGVSMPVRTHEGFLSGKCSMRIPEQLSSWPISQAWPCATASHRKVTGSGALGSARRVLGRWPINLSFHVCEMGQTSPCSSREWGTAPQRGREQMWLRRPERAGHGKGPCRCMPAFPSPGNKAFFCFVLFK